MDHPLPRTCSLSLAAQFDRSRKRDGRALRDAALAATLAPRFVIEGVTPSVEGGRFPVKRIVGDTLTVEADAFGEGHDRIAVALRWKREDERNWRETRMEWLGNDRWRAAFKLQTHGVYLFTIEAWRDEFAIYRDHLAKKQAAGVVEPVDIEEGRRLINRLIERPDALLDGSLADIAERLTRLEGGDAVALLLDTETSQAAAAADPRAHRVTLERSVYVEAERKEAGFASWYELFPRSQSNDPARHGTFDDVIRRLPAIAGMGFDVLYMPPIHPIGLTNRKGPNNTLTAGPDDPGSPYAIGSAAGGHDAIHPELGTFDDFHRLVEACASHGMEVALDIAIQASPDHPWLKQHPDWFDWLPDGTIRFAENPPKKYEDIVNVDFYAAGAKPALWEALRDVFLFWIGHGVKLFRVDNPHTKPLPFWEWLIADIRRQHPEVVFLAEAFTTPKVTYRLAKIGYNQSYTYFTWRNSKQELQDYFTELSHGAPRDFFRPHLFVNTPDINPDFLQDAPRAAFLIRAVLATTLSGLWGMYNGFEICEGRPDARRKEYADSEKYQLVAWDWDRPGNIISEIAALNRIRRENPALQSHLTTAFHNAWNDQILYYEKATPDRSNVLLIMVNLDPHHAQECHFEVPLWNFGLPDDGTVIVEDLLHGYRFPWSGKTHWIRLDPAQMPFAIWRLTLPNGE
ncbi:MAG: alpha-1,4-glucan--maltose-1-phosphate maltosyltransferase [Beijerinckiaceae bacterium]|nr:alpha-1,4-glucan--maltose-1-phosphate maltosyltransferase [Beijerinckiaceae bacterium]